THDRLGEKAHCQPALVDREGRQERKTLLAKAELDKLGTPIGFLLHAPGVAAQVDQGPRHLIQSVLELFGILDFEKEGVTENQRPLAWRRVKDHLVAECPQEIPLEVDA